jgi:menaquinone-dependent protoporphyrinogen oxidase
MDKRGIMSPKHLSRRDLLKIGCTGTAAAGAAACGIGGAVLAGSDPPAVDTPSYSFGGKNMNHRILVAYATYAGSTAEVAAEIGRVLSDHNAQVDVRPVKEITDVASYSAVVVGSPIHGGWLPEAVEFVRAHQTVLARKPFALFVMSIGLVLSDTESTHREFRKRLAPVHALTSTVDEGYFAGKLELNKIPFLYRIPMAILPQGDHRDWTKIRAWAGELYGKLLPN